MDEIEINLIGKNLIKSKAYNREIKYNQNKKIIRYIYNLFGYKLLSIGDK